MESKGPDLAHAQDDVIPYILRMLEHVFAWRGPYDKVCFLLVRFTWQ